ncbi:MAG: hypothetical protein IPK69_01210 [Phycisphaerales bacterium]|nr:MAG: hypothetical protein IPK69_01210 [Phycisphaerales bacterium]
MRSDHRNRTGPSANRAKTSAMVRAAVGGLVVLAGLTTPSTSALAQTPSIEYIQPSPGFTSTTVTGISHDGVVVGWSYTLGGSSNGPVFRYAPGGTRTEYAAGDLPRISGDGLVVGFSNSFTPNVPPRLYYDDGTFRDLPNVSLAGQTRQGRVTHLNTDGSIAMLNTSFVDSIGRSTAYRWTESGGVQIPPFPGGSTWNHANGMSSDGSIVVGDWAFNSTVISGPWAWDTSQPALTPLVTQSGQPILFGNATAITGDGRTIYASGFAIHDGVAVGWTDGAPFTGIFPSGASYDGSVLVGALGAPDGFGSWIWTQETGVMRAVDFFQYHGVDTGDLTLFSQLIVSGDGLHFASGPVLVTIPTPGAMVSLILAGTLATTRRRR